MVSGIILGGVLFHVDGENLGFGWISVKTHSDDNPRLPGRGLFFSEITRPWNLGTCFGHFRFIFVILGSKFTFRSVNYSYSINCATE